MGIVNLYFRSLLILSVMFSGIFLIFASIFLVLGVDASYWFVIPLIALIFIFAQFLIGPWIYDFFLPWLYSLQWHQVDTLPPHLSNFIATLEKDHKFSFKHVGIIDDNNPNAFVYGHFRKNARLVITQGIFTYLTNEEQQSVVAHECGHVVHRDFIWMTLASAIPVIAYTLYAGLRIQASQMSRSKGSSKEGNQLGAVMIGIALGAWLVYFITGYLVLLLSRVREYYADRFSAEVTGQPDDLGRALVKIAYGMIVSEAKLAEERAEGTADSKSKWKSSFHKGIRAMGIFDGNSAQAMSMSVQGRGQTLDPDSVAKAASWDLNHPWAKFIELNSTHPLPAKRLRALDKYAVNIGREPQFPDIGKVKNPESLWDEFFIELFLMYVLPLLIFIMPVLGYVSFLSADNPQISPMVGAGLGFIIVALLWYYRKTVRYPKVKKTQEAVNVTFPLTDLTKNGYYEASPVRGKAVAVEGTVIGRGTPGYFLSEDLVIQDETGIVRIDYQPLFGFLAWFFALFRVPKLIGQEMRVIGWYHRTPTPAIKVWKMYTSERNFHNRWAGANMFLVLLLLLIGIILVIVGLTG